MDVCRATKANGESCTLLASGSHWLCWAHAPENAEKRRTNASRAAKSKGHREVANLKADVRNVITKVERGDLHRNDAACMIQGYRVLKDLIELERRVKTTEELTEQIRELRARVERGQHRA